MKNLKYIAIYSAGYTLSCIILHWIVGVDTKDSFMRTAGVAAAYLVANFAGDIERIVRNRDAA